MHNYCKIQEGYGHINEELGGMVEIQAMISIAFAAASTQCLT